MHSRLLAAILLIASGSVLAATISQVPKSSFPSDALVVTFDQMPASTTSYTENGVNITNSGNNFLSFGGSSKFGSGRTLYYPSSSQTLLFKFPYPVTQVGFEEWTFPPSPSNADPTAVFTLYSDAAGTNPIGIFTHSQPYTFGTPRFDGIISDTPFYSMRLNPQSSTFNVDDLRIVPEPSGAYLLLAAGAGAMLLHRRRPQAE